MRSWLHAERSALRPGAPDGPEPSSSRLELWQVFSNLTDADMKAIFAYLKSLAPVKNRVPDAVIAPPPPSK